MAAKYNVIFLVLHLFCFDLDLSMGYVAESSYNQYEWAETNGNLPVTGAAKDTNLSRELALERLNALRLAMSSESPPVDAYIVPTADAHNSQYISPTDARREWICGLSGSSGVAVVTQEYALVWTDGRYYTQFEHEVNGEYWTLMRQSSDMTIPTWLTTNLTAGAVVGIDPTTYTRNAWISLQGVLSQHDIRLLAVADNLVDVARVYLGDPPPPRRNKPLIVLPVQYSGRLASEKISELMRQMETRGASVLVLTALDDIAYTLNLRGDDIPYNPVFFSYLIITSDPGTLLSNVILFWGEGVLSENVTEHLSTEGVTIATEPYGNNHVFSYLSDMTNGLPEGSIVWLTDTASEAIYAAASGNGGVRILSTLSPVALMKYIKNEVELQGFRNSHVKDGIAVVRFLRWIHEEVDSGNNVTEIMAVEKLEQLRDDEVDFMGPSFSTIAGAGENGAIIHYSPSSEGESRVVTSDDMFLVDSGGQYKDGTTDITRTRHMGYEPTDKQRLAFTRVLKGQIMLGTAVFPRGSTGNVLDTLARKALWDVGLNYAHGTGHGVGHYLNVHEGPSGIGTGAVASDPGIVPGMIFSNEPGYYEVGEFGIRHEDLVEVVEMTSDADHIYAKGLVDNFEGRGAVGFYTISLAPHQTACINVKLLTEDELRYINDYHARVLATLGPVLQSRNLHEDYAWLQKECAAIGNSGFLTTATPLLAIITVLTLWFQA